MSTNLPSLLSRLAGYPAVSPSLGTLQLSVAPSLPDARTVEIKSKEYALFDAPSGAANPNHWARQDYLTPDQCIPVLWSRNPDRFDYKQAHQLCHESVRATRFFEDVSTLARSIEAGSLSQRTAPHQLLAWARQKGMRIDGRFADAVKRIWPRETVDWKSVAQQYQTKILQLEQVVDRFASTILTERSQHQAKQAELHDRVATLSRRIEILQSSVDTERVKRSRLQGELDAARLKHSEEKLLSSQAIDRARTAEQNAQEAANALREASGREQAETLRIEELLRTAEADRDEARDIAADLTDQLNALPKKLKSPSATTKELRTAQRLFFGVVAAKYEGGSDPMSGLNYQRLTEDLARAGVTADDETIRKHHRAGSEENSR